MRIAYRETVGIVRTGKLTPTEVVERAPRTIRGARSFAIERFLLECDGDGLVEGYICRGVS